MSRKSGTDGTDLEAESGRRPEVRRSVRSSSRKEKRGNASSHHRYNRGEVETVVAKRDLRPAPLKLQSRRRGKNRRPDGISVLPGNEDILPQIAGCETAGAVIDPDTDRLRRQTAGYHEIEIMIAVDVDGF